jgi:hypothetical protein
VQHAAHFHFHAAYFLTCIIWNGLHLHCFVLFSFFYLVHSNIDKKIIMDKIVEAHHKNETFAIKIGEFSSLTSAKLSRNKNSRHAPTGTGTAGGGDGDGGGGAQHEKQSLAAMAAIVGAMGKVDEHGIGVAGVSGVGGTGGERRKFGISDVAAQAAMAVGLEIAVNPKGFADFSSDV